MPNNRQLREEHVDRRSRATFGDDEPAEMWRATARRAATPSRVVSAASSPRQLRLGGNHGRDRAGIAAGSIGASALSNMLVKGTGVVSRRLRQRHHVVARYARVTCHAEWDLAGRGCRD